MQNDIEVILVGDELLKGQRQDAHLSYLGRRVAQLGLRIARAHVIGDDLDTISATVAQCLTRSRIVITTGGLGPTPDDITCEAVARGMELDLEFHEPSWQRILDFFQSRGVEPSDANRKQAHFPAGSTVIENAHGTAPGCHTPQGDCDVFVLPGPPLELNAMYEKYVADRLADIFQRDPLRMETFRTINIGESQLMDQHGDVLEGLTAFELSSLPSGFGVDIILTAKRGADTAALDREAELVKTALSAGLGTKFYEHGERDLAQVLGALLTERGETLAIAESLTGGKIGAMFTDTAGSSAYLLADAVTYSNESKIELLKVRKETIEEYGAVSDETCIEMAHGIRNRTDATYGLATTGIAGPDGGTSSKPVGLTYLGIAWDGGSSVKRSRFRGNRDTIRRRSMMGALWLLYDYICKH